jgi:LytR cell envelope-related transcriptional attenuator
MSLARLRALIIVGVLVAAAAVLVTVTLVKDTQADSTLEAGCGPGDVRANIKFPAKYEDVKINVFNATTSPHIAGQVADDFRSRKITVLKEANDPATKKVDDVAHVRYGPSVVGSAWLIRAHFLNDAKLQFDINRKDDVIDVVVGGKFKQLGSTTEVNQALAAAGAPTLPPGTCDANAAR